MEKIYEISTFIDTVIETIAPFGYDNSYIPPISLNTYNLQTILNKLKVINLFEIEEELWTHRIEFKPETEIISLMYMYFRNLFTWKENINTTSELLESFNADIEILNSRYFDCSIEISDPSAIRKLYPQIGLKIFNLKYDFKKIMSNFKERLENFKKIEAQKPLQVNPFKFRLYVDQAM